MMPSPLVSFCFTTYKRQDLLRSTLLSVQNQTFTNFEVIVSDNDPEEMGRSVVEGLNDSRFKYFANGENLGMKKSFVKSFERSNGQFTVMIADDDPVYPEMLETLVNLSEKYSNAGMYMGGSDWYCTNPKVAALYQLNVGTNSFLSNDLELGAEKQYSGSEFLFAFFNLQIAASYLWSTCMVRRKVLIEMGGVPDYGTPFLGDYAYLSLMGAHSGIAFVNRSLGCQTIHAQNFGRNQNEQIAIAAKNVPEYLKHHLKNKGLWNDNTQALIQKFVGLWVIGHMAFLHKYGESIDLPSLQQAEKDVFQIDYMKSFRLKYVLKKNMPVLHQILVNLKKKLHSRK